MKQKEKKVTLKDHIKVDKFVLSTEGFHIFDIFGKKIRALADKHQLDVQLNILHQLAMAEFDEKYQSAIITGKNAELPTMSQERIASVIEVLDAVLEIKEKPSSIKLAAAAFMLCNVLSTARLNCMRYVATMNMPAHIKIRMPDITKPVKKEDIN